jgi:hypothetical protein
MFVGHRNEPTDKQNNPVSNLATAKMKKVLNNE